MPHEATAGDLLLVVAIVKSLITILGGLITYYAFKAYRRTGDRGLGLLCAGFATITIGAITAGISFEIIGVDLAVGMIIDGIFMIVGFALIAYSLRVN